MNELMPRQRTGSPKNRRQRNQNDQPKIKQRVAQRKLEAGQHVVFFGFKKFYRHFLLE
jgi:hypothetical protein